MERKEQEVSEEYLSSLADLNLNSKPLINMLTILAEENIEYAPVIVKAVEQHISKVNPDVKLPVLYLIDSIVKNVRRDYITLFSHRIVNIFCGVFEKVNEKIREKMYTLRQTWNDVFTTQKLYALDVKVNCMDPNWPITAKVSTKVPVSKSPAIHVNPNFLKNQTEPRQEMEAKLRDKQRQLLELQKRKLELELAATKQRLEEQEKQLSLQTETVNPSINLLTTVIPATIATVAPSTIRQQIFPAFKQQNVVVPSTTVSSQNFMESSSNSTKPRIAPVNPGMINTLRHRDPRLARQQQQQQQQQQQERNLQQQQHPLDSNVSNSIHTNEILNSTIKASSTEISDIVSNELKDTIKTESSPNRDIVKKSEDKSDNKATNSNRSSSNSRSSTSYHGDKERSKSSSSSTGNNTGSKKHRDNIYERSNDKPPSSRFKNSMSRSSSSSSISKQLSSNSGNKLSSEKDNRSKDKGSSVRDDDKRKSSSSSNSKSNSSPNRSAGIEKSKTERSPKRSTTESPKTAIGASTSSPSTSPTKFKENKQNLKSRNYVKRDREKSDSILQSTTEKPRDIDLRTVVVGAIPDKRIKLDETLSSRQHGSIQVSSSSIVSNTSSFRNLDDSTCSSTKSKDLEKICNQKFNLDLEAVKSMNKDVDLRQFPTTATTKTTTTTNKTTASANKQHQNLLNKNDNNDNKISSLSPSSNNDRISSPSSNDKDDNKMDIDTKKRQFTMVNKLDEPAAKKIKPEDENIDNLFGTEDVDLRNLSGVPLPHLAKTLRASGVMPMTPPPPPIISNESENWAKVKGSKPNNKLSPINSTLDDVRAKLAKAARTHLQQKIDKKDNRKSRFSDLNEDSSDGTDANIRTIISQAQELLVSENINVDQYNTLVKTVIQINETNKLKEAQRRESLQNNANKSSNANSTSSSSSSNNNSSNSNSSNKTSSPPSKTTTSTDSSKTSTQQTGDENVKRENEEEANRILIAKSKALQQKRIPKLSKDTPTAEIKVEQNSILHRSSPPISSNTTNYSDSRNNSANIKSEKRIGNRQKDTKWSPWDQSGQQQNHSVLNQQQNKPWINQIGSGGNVMNRSIPSQFNSKMQSTLQPLQLQIHQNQNRMQIPNPWNNPPSMIFAGSNIPSAAQGLLHQQVSQQQIINLGGSDKGIGGGTPGSVQQQQQQQQIQPITQFSNSVDNPKDDIVRSINIDSVAKEIRIYDEIAIVFMDWDQPREIGFQNGQRRIIIDDQEPFLLNFNDNYKTILIDNKPHKIRFGCPSRELYIDDNWYECFFGGPPIAIPIDGKIHIFKIEGPPPQVNIGNLRQDLVIGKINFIIDARILIPVFLDAKIQKFELDGRKHTLQFADSLKTVLIDGEPINFEYGGLPRSLYLGGVKYFVRFGTLPNGIIPGKCYIKDMICTEKFPPLLPPPPQPTSLGLIMSSVSTAVTVTPSINSSTSTTNVITTIVPDINTNIDSISMISSNPEQLPLIGGSGINESIPSVSSSTIIASTTTTTTATESISAENVTAANAAIAISQQKIIETPTITSTSTIPSSGIPPTVVGTITDEAKPTQPILPPIANLNIDELFQKLLASGILNHNSSNTSISSQQDSSSNGTKKIKEEIIRPIDLSKSETIKQRQSGIVQKLFSGMQCSSCGLRFPPEQTMKYSQHLDWHFRQNRRERDSSRKAHSRKWYYDISDWVQYEEIEDLDEREKNWFETQQNELDNNHHNDDNSNQFINSPLQTCPAGPDDVDRSCDMCHDKFEQFYNEESEEWHLKSAVRVDDKIYHPLCYQDYKASLTFDETTAPIIEGAEDDNAVDAVVVKEESTDNEKSEVVVADDDEDDDDVIVLPTEEPSVTEIPSDDEEDILNLLPPDSEIPESEKIDEKNEDENLNDSVESDVEIQEPHIPFTDLDTYEEPPASLSTNDDSSQQSQSFKTIKIKEEPKDSDNEDDAFEDVGTFITVDDLSQSVDEYIPQATTTTTTTTTTTVQAADNLVASIDGNVDIQDTQQTANIGVNKIKLNITKNLQSTTSVSTTTATIKTISKIPTTITTTTTQQQQKAQNIPVIGSGSAIPVICSSSFINNDISSNATITTTTIPSTTSNNLLININTKINKQKNISSFSEDNNSNVGGVGDKRDNNSCGNVGGGGDSKAKNAITTCNNSNLISINDHKKSLDDGSSIEYELKSQLRGIEFKKTPKVKSGYETSGLCSIM